MTTVGAIDDLLAEIERLREENASLREALDRVSIEAVPDARLDAWTPTLFAPSEPALRRPPINARSDPAAKIDLFRSLFIGRDDVYAIRWDNARSGKSGWSPAVRGGALNAKRPDREYLPLTDAVIDAHLRGDIHAGLYPLLRNDRCLLLAADFDGPSAMLDAAAYADAARAVGLPVALERSRSGDGAHAWMFFAGAVPASAARRVGAYLLREAMAARAELDLGSYDRMFPAQDFVPAGSFGNLIALPLHGASRKKGRTVFVDARTGEPAADQWAFLASVGRVPAASILSLAESVSMVAAGPDTRVYRAPRDPSRHPVPPEVHATAGAMLTIDRVGMPPAVVAALKHLASLHNPEYYEKERLRLSTWRTPRFIRCYGETLGQLLLPRGLRDVVGDVLREAGSRLIVADGAPSPPPIDVRLAASLSPEQLRAAEAVLAHELGVLVAPPGSGKTVVACAAIARRALPTLVIVDRQPLVQQWRERLEDHLGLGRKEIGVIASGRARPKGIVDIAMVQSLARRDDLVGLTAGYAHVVVDECHHVPATMFEKVVRQIAAPAWLGLTATPYRRDGLEGLITMYCGPVRHRMAPAPAEAFERTLRVHPTAHAVSGPSFGEEPGPTSIQRVFRELVDDADRTRRIAGDVAGAAGAGRNCLVLSQWTEHVRGLAASVEERGVQPLVLHGSMGRRARASVLQELGGLRPGEGKVLVATGSLLGEGFDCPALDTLFLAFPIAFKGRLVQYVGRVLRPLDGKLAVEVHDYVDADVPVLARMHGRRLPAYASLGFDVTSRQRTRQSGET